jgi:hypothetical protein
MLTNHSFFGRLTNSQVSNILHTYIFACVGLCRRNAQLPNKLEQTVDVAGAISRLRPPDLESNGGRGAEIGGEGEQNAVLQSLVVQKERVPGEVDSCSRRGQHVTDAHYLTYMNRNVPNGEQYTNTR